MVAVTTTIIATMTDGMAVVTGTAAVTGKAVAAILIMATTSVVGMAVIAVRRETRL